MPSPLAPLSGLVSGLLDRSRAGFRWLKPDKQALTVGVVVFVTLATTLGIVALGRLRRDDRPRGDGRQPRLSAGVDL